MKRSCLWLGPLVAALAAAPSAFAKETPAPTKKVIQPARAAAAAEAASPAMLIGDTLYVAGQTGVDAKGALPAAFADQVKQALANAGRVLKAARLGFANVVKANVYLTDIKSFDEMNGLYRKIFTSNLPARTTVAVPALPGGAQFQIALIASRKPHKALQPAGVPRNPKLAYSPAVLVGGETLYLSGQGSRDVKTGQLPAGEIEAHTKQTLENIRLLLEAAGMTPANVVTANVYLTDMALIGRMNEVYRTFFASEPPSRTTVGVPALPGDVPIEITFVATRSGKQVFIPEGSNPNPNFSEAVAAGPMYYPAGKVGKGEGIEAHAQAALDGIGNALKRGGRSFGDVVEAKVYLTDLKDQDKMLAVFRNTFPKDPPALTTTAVSKLVGSNIIEITLVAAGGAPAAAAAPTPAPAR